MVAKSCIDRVGTFAFYSRFLVILLQGFFNLLMPDHQAKVFNPPSSQPLRGIDLIVGNFLVGLRRWDGCYFMHIAEYGYTYENTLAFFPMYPMLVRLLSNTVFLPLQYVLQYSNVLLITSTVLNFCLFVRTAKVLFTLSKDILHDETLALKAAQLFCINPASIFFSACYSEVSFAFFTFSGMLYLEQNALFKASIIFSLSGFTRSNGVINLGFILFKILKNTLKDLFENTTIHQKNNFDLTRSQLTVLLRAIMSALFYSFIVISPFLLYQYYAYRIFCNEHSNAADISPHALKYGIEQGYKMPHTGISEWCGDVIPISYSHIQDKHWNVGFLRYYEKKQFPNFLLAAPMTIIILSGVIYYIRSSIRNSLCLEMHSGIYHKKYDDHLSDTTFDLSGFYSTRCFVYIIHALALLIFGIMFMHIQVITRFMASSSPILYWFIATVTVTAEEMKQRKNIAEHNCVNLLQHLNPPTGENGFRSGDENLEAQEKRSADVLDWGNEGWANKLLFLYFHLYYFVGIAAFSNFLPWT